MDGLAGAESLSDKTVAVLPPWAPWDTGHCWQAVNNGAPAAPGCESTPNAPFCSSMVWQFLWCNAVVISSALSSLAFPGVRPLRCRGHRIEGTGRFQGAVQEEQIRNTNGVRAWAHTCRWRKTCKPFSSRAPPSAQSHVCAANLPHIALSSRVQRSLCGVVPEVHTHA